MDSFRVVRVGALLFAMFSVGWAAVISRDPTALASEMWPVGLGAAAVFTARGRAVPAVIGLVGLIGFATFVLGGRGMGLAVGGGIAIALEAWLIAVILTRGGRIRPRLQDDDDFSRFVVAMAAGGAVAAVVAMFSLGRLDPGDMGLIALGTFVGHTTATLFHLPFFLDTFEHGAVAPAFERAAQWCLVLGLTVLVFVPVDFTALLFLLAPVLGWGARRLSLAEVQWQLVIVATIATFMTVFGLGPLAEAPDVYTLPADVTGILLQSFLLACGLVAVPLAVVAGQQVRDARQLRMERDKLQRIVNTASVAIVGTDEIGRITLFNPGAQQLLGYAPEDVLGQSTTMLHTPAAVREKAVELGVPDDFVAVVLKLAQPETGVVRIRFLCKDGTERTHSLTLSRLVDERGEVIGYVGTSEDDTERVLAHDALVAALEVERRAVEQLKEVDQVKESFVSAVSHELRTPITSIVGFLEMLGDGTYGDLNRQQSDAVDRVHSNSRRLLSLIDELLTLSRVHDAGLGMVGRELDLGTVVRTAYDVVEPAWAARDLAVSLDLPPQPVPFVGDEDMLERVVVNLVGNAVKFTPEGGRIAVSLHGGDGGAVIEVVDTGIGIPAEELDLLFTRFFRSTNAQQRAIPGSGLGLSIARAIVEMHGGDVTVQSQAGVGTTFRVWLPSGVRPTLT